MTSRFTRGYKFDNVTYNIIPFVSISFTWLLFFTTFSRHLNRNINIFINKLKYDKTKINLKLNEIKLIPYQCKRFLSDDILTAWAP